MNFPRHSITLLIGAIGALSTERIGGFALFLLLGFWTEHLILKFDKDASSINDGETANHGKGVK